MLDKHIDLYLSELDQAVRALDRQAVWAVAEQLMHAWRERRQVFLLGNGGSAALASHMACDLSMIVVPGLPRFRVVALTDNVPLITAWANDTAYENIFTAQLHSLCQPGDVVVAISCSGNSPNVLAALRVARESGARTIGLTGSSGGKLKDLVDLCVFAPAQHIWQQEDIHLTLDHVISSTLRKWIGVIAQRAAPVPKAMLLAAGEGTRLRPLTVDKPKPMLPINGKPLLEHTVEWLQRHGLKELAINLHHCPDVVESHFGDGSAWGMDIRYSREDPILGTAGAVRKLAGFLNGGPFIVVYGDVLTDIDLQRMLAFHHQVAALDPSVGATLSLYHVPNPTEVGLVEMDARSRITRFVEKPRPEEVFTDLANAGVLIVEPHVIEHIPPDTFYDFGRDLFPRLLENGVPLYGWVVPTNAYLLDIGTPEKYSQAQSEWPFHMRSH